MNGLRVSSRRGGFGPGPVPTSGDPRGTVLYDAVFLAADEKLRTEVGRKVIVLITDGVDEGSRKKIEDAIEAAQKADAVVYSIDYSDPRAYGNYGPFGGFGGGAGEATCAGCPTRPAATSTKWAATTPCKTYSRSCRKKCAASIRSASRPPTRSGTAAIASWEVRMANKDLKAQVRKGYYAVKPEAR